MRTFVNSLGVIRDEKQKPDRIRVRPLKEDGFIVIDAEKGEERRILIGEGEKVGRIVEIGVIGLHQMIVRWKSVMVVSLHKAGKRKRIICWDCYNRIVLSHTPKRAQTMEETNKRGAEEASIQEGEPAAKKCEQTTTRDYSSEKDVGIELLPKASGFIA